MMSLYYLSLVLFVCVVFVTVEAAHPSAGSFKRILIIPFENEDSKSVLVDDYMFGLTKKGTYFSNFYAETHPSQPNYIALTSGSLNGVDSDMNHDVDAESVADLLERKGLTWKNYAQGFPGNCVPDGDIGPYRRKHVPFMSYNNIRNNTARCANIVPSNQFEIDYDSGNLPHYMFYTPDVNNDGHDTSISYSSNWLQGFLDPLLADKAFMNETLIVITYDEGNLDYKHNLIYTVVIGAGAVPNTLDDRFYNHYDVLRMVEDNFELGDLGKFDAETDRDMLSYYQWAPPSHLKQPINPIIIIVVSAVGSAIFVAGIIVGIVVIVRRRRSTLAKKATDGELETTYNIVIKLDL